MGCDIHAVIEVRGENGRWVPVAFPDCPRDYEAFGRLVRDHGRASTGWGPAIAARGIPSNSVYADAEAIGILGDHTFSWLTGRQFLRAIGDREGWKLARYDVEDWLARTAVAECRVVFGFDS